MQYLIDTHVCLWAIADKEKLSNKVRTILEDTHNKIIVSQISLFEIAIKLKVGKLPEFDVLLPEFLTSIIDTGFEIIELKNEHILVYATLDFPENHRDPFDRLLISTATYEKVSLISKDEKFLAYSGKLEIIW